MGPGRNVAKGRNLADVDQLWPESTVSDATLSRRRPLSAVARYFFHLKAELLWHDEEGCELADVEAARQCAEQRARSVCQSRLMDPADSIQVTSDDGTIVLAVSFGEATAYLASATVH